MNEPDAQPAPSSPDRPKLRPGLIRRTFRRRWVSLLTQWALITTALWLSAYLLLVGPYESSSMIRVVPGQIGLFGVKDAVETPEQLVQTQVWLIESPAVLLAAAADPKVAKLSRIATAQDAAAEIRSAIRVRMIPGTTLIQVTAESPTTGFESALIANAVVDAYLKANSQWIDGVTLGQIQALEDYAIMLRRQSEDLEDRWKTIVARGDLGEEAKRSNLISPQHGTKIEEKLVEVDLKRIEARARLQAFKDRPPTDPKLVEDLEREILGAELLEKALNERRASAGFDPRKPRTDEVDIALLQERRQYLREVADTINRRIEQLKFEAKNPARVRKVSAAMPSARRTLPSYRPWVLVALPFATFAAVLGLFSAIEARPGRARSGLGTKSDD